jgi:hypothetical protein
MRQAPKQQAESHTSFVELARGARKGTRVLGAT